MADAPGGLPMLLMHLTLVPSPFRALIMLVPGAKTSGLMRPSTAGPRLPLLATLLQQLESYYEAAERGISPQPAWEKELLTLGCSVHVSTSVSGMSMAVDGIVEGTGQWGELLVRDRSGHLHEIAAGDVTLRDARLGRD